MAVFRIRKRSDGSFRVVGTLGDNRHLVAREVANVADLVEAAEAVEAMANRFADARKNVGVDAS